MPATDDTRWSAVLRRDSHFDGAFVYAVRATGIYCRPSCPARRPERAQVEFFAGPEAAERAGYRPCRRCEPRQAAPQAEMVRRVCRHIDENSDRQVGLAELGAVAGMSPEHMQRTFKRLTGVSPRQYADARRVESVKKDFAPEVR